MYGIKKGRKKERGGWMNVWYGIRKEGRKRG